MRSKRKSWLSWVCVLVTGLVLVFATVLAAKEIAERYNSVGVKHSNDYYAGIDFWKSNRQHLPNYNLCRNLIQNPSFEGGLRYYRYAAASVCPVQKEYERLYSIDDTESKFGHRSLAMRAVKKLKTLYRSRDRYGGREVWAYPLTIGTFVMPVEANKRYTFSFYAKGNRKNGLVLSIYGATVNHPTKPKWKGKTWFNITTEWQRYHASFITPNTGVGIYLSGRYNGDDPSGEGKVWVDGLQLEQGDLTDYVEKPLYSQFLTSDPDNFLKNGVPINAHLFITAKPGAAGKVSVEIEDYFYHRLWKDKFKFKTNANGTAIVHLSLDGKLPRGIFVMKADFELNSGFKDTDYYRLSIMDFLRNKHRHRTICSNQISRGYLRLRDIFKRYHAIGIGSFKTPRNDVREQYKFELIKEFGIFHTGAYLMDPEKENGRIEAGGKTLVKNIRDIGPEDLTPEFLKKFEDACYEKARSMPYVKSWNIASELSGYWPAMETCVKLHEAAYRGLKRANPDMIFIVPGPWNMMPSGGIRWLDDFFTAGAAKIPWGAIDIHTYRTLPEDPDLDADTVVFLKMLDRHGLGKVPVWWIEGMYYPPYYIPAWGLSCYNGGASADHYYAGSPSYHMGWGERIAAAFSARSWLVGLKYSHRIKSFECFAISYRFFMDVNLTPFAIQKIPNTLGHFLGNADYKEDIRFSPKVRCYVFEDEKKRPIAAIWSHIKNVDRGKEQSPMAIIPFGKETPEFFNLMEVPIKVVPDKNGNCCIEASPFPTFIRGKPGTIKRFCASLCDARLEDAKFAPVNIAAKMKGEGNISVKVQNLLTRAFKGKLSIDAQEKPVQKLLNLSSKETLRINVPLSRHLRADEVISIDLPIVVTEEGEAPIKVDASFRCFAVKKHTKPIKVDGKFNDWKGIPEIQLKNKYIWKVPAHLKAKYPDGIPLGGDKDHSATFRMAWDEEHLYLAVNVRDDKFVSEKRKSIPFQYNNDTLQTYFDTLCDARTKTSTGFDTNDYSYDFFPSKDNTVIAFRRFAPEFQMTEGLKPEMVEPNVKAAFRQVKGGYVYEIAFPQRYIIPIRLEAGFACGIAIFLIDHDGECMKWAHTLTPEGTVGYKNPHLYPVMLLVE